MPKRSDNLVQICKRECAVLELITDYLKAQQNNSNSEYTRCKLNANSLAVTSYNHSKLVKEITANDRHQNRSVSAENAESTLFNFNEGN